MKRLAIVLLLLGFGMELKAQLPRYLWAKGWGGSQSTSSYTLAVDTGSNVIVGGEFRSVVDFDPGPGVFNIAAGGANTVFISKLGPSGGFVWAKMIGGKRSTFLRSLTTDKTGNIYACGWFVDTIDIDPGPGIINLVSKGKTDGYLIKLNPNGGLIWYKQLGDTAADVCRDIVLDGRGNVYSAGYFHATVDFDPGAAITNLTTSSGNAFLWKLDTAGNFSWAKQIGGSGVTGGAFLALDGTSNIYISGYVIGIADLDPGVGVASVSALLKQKDFILKLDSAGNYVWAHTIGDTANTWGAQIAAAQDGSVYLCGLFEGSIDFDPGPGTARLVATTPSFFSVPPAGDIYLMKLNSSGNLQWANKFGSMRMDAGNGLTVDSKSNVYMVGQFTDTVDFDPGPATSSLFGSETDVFITKMDSSGKLVWCYNAGGNKQDMGVDVKLTPNGDVYACGEYWSRNADFDQTSGTAILSGQGWDAFVVRLSQVKGSSGGGGVGVENFALNGGLLVYPNPTTGVVTLKVSNNMRDGRVRLYSMSGQSIREYVWNSGREFVVDVRDVAAGVYFVEVSGDGGEVYRGRVLRGE